MKYPRARANVLRAAQIEDNTQYTEQKLKFVGLVFNFTSL